MIKNKELYDYGRGLKVVRVALGFDQKSFAKTLGVDPSYLSRIESGEKEPSLKIFKRIDRKFDIPREVVDILSINNNELSNVSSEEIREFGEIFLQILQK